MVHPPKQIRKGRQGLVSAIALLVFAVPAFAQQATNSSLLTLSHAVQIALEKDPLRKAALADTKAASAGVQEARSALIPHLTFSETATRGNDPVYVFGSRLRQQRFTTADFALSQLNTPRPFGDFNTKFGGSWNLFDSFASWRRVEQAKQMKAASVHQLDRAGQETVFRAVDTYYNVLLAAKQLEIAEQAVKTAQSIFDSSKARQESGLALESDLLSAQVRFSARQQELVRARNNLALAKTQLNIVLGLPSGTSQELSEVGAEQNLPLPAVDDAEKTAITQRPDLKRIQAEESAQKLSVAIAKSSFGPRLNAFASWGMDNPTLFAGGGGNNWVGGIELQMDLFTGGAKRAQLSREKALAEKVSAMKQAATDAVRLEVRRAYYDADASRQQVEVSRGAVAQAQESLRVYQNRYQAGLATITDLLAGEEASRRTQSDYWEAVYRFHTSYASLELASGTLNPESPVVKP
jgi:outer membrane protein